MGIKSRSDVLFGPRTTSMDWVMEGSTRLARLKRLVVWMEESCERRTRVDVYGNVVQHKNTAYQIQADIIKEFMDGPPPS